MKALKIIGIIALVIVVAIIGFVMSLKGESHLERTIAINASADKVYSVVNDFGENKNWSPWFMIDPETKYEFSENTIGVGAKYSWDSEHPDVRTGKQEILESIENEYVNTQMWFGGMTGTYTAAFKIKPTENGVDLTWTLESKADNAGEKFFIDYISEDAIGTAYDEGLVSLKTYVEGLPDPEPELNEVDSLGVVEAME